MTGRGIRLIATDLDGTIVRPDGSISEVTRAAFRRCRDAGIRIVVVTGRPPRWMPDIVAALDLVGVVICANGALVLDAPELVVRSGHFLAPASITAVLDAACGLQGHVNVAVETPSGMVDAPSETGVRAWREEPGTTIPMVGSVAELSAVPQVVKVLVRVTGGPLSIDAATARLAQDLSGVVEVTHSGAQGVLVEASAPGVSKATTLAAIAKGWGIGAEECIAFGDMPNDLAMLRWAGRGYGVAGGHPDVLAATDLQAPSVGEDGVADVLDHYVLGLMNSEK